MPLYEYCCSECDYKFELLRPITRCDEDMPCPRCHNSAKRMLSKFASFSKDSDGLATSIAGTSGSCSGCTSTNCSSC